MTVVSVQPGSAQWLSLITPSKVAAILGVSRWESPYSLWHRMAGNLPAEEPKDIYAVGHAFEPALAYLWKAENEGWQLSPHEVQVSHSDFGFPVAATLDRRARRGKLRRVVEFKIARSLEEWGDPDLDGEPPADYAAQVLAQMHITGYAKLPGHLMVMGPFFRHHTYEIVYDPGLAAVIEKRCLQFYESLQRGEPPELDDHTATYDTVRALHPHISTTDSSLLDPVLAADWLYAAAIEKEAKARLLGLKTRVLDAMGDSQYAEAGGQRVARRQKNGRGGISLYPASKITSDELREMT